jgi:hypothetical protein
LLENVLIGLPSVSHLHAITKGRLAWGELHELELSDPGAREVDRRATIPERGAGDPRHVRVLNSLQDSPAVPELLVSQLRSPIREEFLIGDDGARFHAALLLAGGQPWL